MGTCINLEKFTQSRIVVVGDLMLDRYLWGDVERISPEAPVPVFHVKKLSEIPGGAGNVVSNLTGLGCSVIVIGVCGNDATGERLNGLLQNARVETHILSESDRPTVTKTRVVCHGQQLLRLDEEEIGPVGSKMKRDVIDIVESSVRKCNAIILSDYGKGLLQSEEVSQGIINLAKESNIPVIIDPKGRDWERYRGATCVTPNVKELELVHGDTVAIKEQLVQAMRCVLGKYNLEWLVVTRGPLGMCLMDRNAEPIFIPTLARQVYDVSGAGDTVVATLAAGVGSGYTFPDSAKVANLAAGIVVGKAGTQPINMFELKISLQTTGVESTTSDYVQKIASRPAATIQVDGWKASRQKIVFTNGCFDLLHPGHIHLLNQAKHLGDHLVVAINSDASVRRLKGPGRPILAERDRACLLASLDSVDLVMVFESDTPEELLKALKPDILVKGSDHKLEEVVGRAIVESYGGTVQFIPVLTGYSTTTIAHKVLESYGNSAKNV